MPTVCVAGTPKLPATAAQELDPLADTEAQQDAPLGPDHEPFEQENEALPVAGPVESLADAPDPWGVDGKEPLQLNPEAAQDCDVAGQLAGRGVQLLVPLTLSMAPLLPVQAAVSLVTVTLPMMFAAGIPQLPANEAHVADELCGAETQVKHVSVEGELHDPSLQVKFALPVLGAVLSVAVLVWPEATPGRDPEQTPADQDLVVVEQANGARQAEISLVRIPLRLPVQAIVS